MTIKEFIGGIKGAMHMESSDSMANDRLIYSIAKPIANLLIKRETNLRRLFNSPSIFTVIPCVPMEEIPLAKCCDYVSEKVIARSKYRIPNIIDNTFGLLIQYVSDVETSKSITQTTSIRYSNLLKMGNGKVRGTFYWINDGYLFITNPDIKRVNISVCLDEDGPLPDAGDCDCQEPSKDNCIPIYDQQIKIPGYLVDNVSSMTIQKLQRTYSVMPQDVTDNDLDETVK